MKITDESGFTLIEMLVAVAISSVILLMVYTAYNSVIKTVNYGRTVASYYQQLNHILNRIDSDLSAMYWKEGNSRLQFISIFNGKYSILSFVTAEYRDNRIFPSPAAARGTDRRNRLIKQKRIKSFFFIFNSACRFSRSRK